MLRIVIRLKMQGAHNPPGRLDQRHPGALHLRLGAGPHSDAYVGLARVVGIVRVPSPHLHDPRAARPVGISIVGAADFDPLRGSPVLAGPHVDGDA
jgi:hypothetical protein